MGAAEETAAKVFAAHQAWKARGNQSREILRFMVDTDQGALLDEDSKGIITSDFQTFSQVRLRSFYR